jgi:hypothetical protein
MATKTFEEKRPPTLGFTLGLIALNVCLMEFWAGKIDPFHALIYTCVLALLMEGKANDGLIPWLLSFRKSK